jgi:carbamoyl-phosphate synthase small subunit
VVEALALKGVLVLADGSVFFGGGFGAEGTAVGELVFNTSMTGYQEALTDPSYAGQILMMTYPLIGNYGTGKSDFESGRVQASAFVVRERCLFPSHRNSEAGIDAFLAQKGIPGIHSLDTRAIVRRIRAKGVMSACACVYSEGRPELEPLLRKARALDYSKVNFVEKVSVRQVEQHRAPPGKRVALIDCGMKTSIVKELLARRISVTVFPWNATAQQVLACEPDGLVISNGPGDPALLAGVSSAVRELMGRMPVFGICLGHQIIAHAAGARTFKLKFGHRGSNHPVKELATGRVYITAQNHGFAVDAKTLPQGFEETHVNLNDKTNEGLRHKELPVFSVQYHPEANPGPYDSLMLFDRFKQLLEDY